MDWINRFLAIIGLAPEFESTVWSRQGKVSIIFNELLEQIIQEILSLDAAMDGDPGIALMRERIKARAVDASVVYRAEMLLIGRLDINGLRMRIRTLRDLLAGLLTPEAYASFERGLIPDLNLPSVTLEAMRAEAWALASRAYRRYALVPSVEYQRSAIVVRMAFWLGLMSCALYMFTEARGIAVFYPLGLIAGALGAAMSVTMRLYQIDPRNEPLLMWLSVEQGKRSIYLSPVLGAAFGLVFLMVVRANLVSGDLFPNFKSAVWLGMSLADHGCKNLNLEGMNLKAHTAECSETYLQYAKVAVWAFIAGWAERMVPDVLNKLSQQAHPSVPKT